MSNNYYAHLKIGDDITWKLHIGLTVGGKFATLCGRTFPTVQAWYTFLTFNQDKLTVVDEGGETVAVSDIAARLTDFDPIQLDYHRKNGDYINPYPVPENWRGTDLWLDGGVLFSNGTFS